MRATSRPCSRLRLCLTLLGLCGVAACRKAKPPEPSEDFKHDVTVFCGALDEGPLHGLPDLGPRILDRIRTEEFKHLFDMRRDDPSGALFERLDKAVAQAALAACPTLDWMRNGMR